MGALSDFLRHEFETDREDRETKNGPLTPAKVANLANPCPSFSNFSSFSSTPEPIFDPARLQREADRRNAATLRARLTDRFCRCGHLAEFAWLGDDGRDVWICGECLPTRGRA